MWQTVAVAMNLTCKFTLKTSKCVHWSSWGNFVCSSGVAQTFSRAFKAEMYFKGKKST